MFYRGLMVLITMIFSLVVKADFNYEGNGKLIYPTGVKTDLKFGFKVQKTDNGYTFVAGNQEMKVSHVPEKYSIWLSMNPERGVFIQEFSNNYFKEFEWQLGEHKLSLKKKVLTPKRAPGPRSSSFRTVPI